MSDLEAALLDDVRAHLAGWRTAYRGHPELEREQLWLLALEREQIVAVAYREDFVGARIDELQVTEALRAAIRQTLVWIWKDEELHAEYLRGLLLKRGGLGSSIAVYGRQLQGALSGWVAAVENHLANGSAPIRRGAADALVVVAGATGRVPAVLRRELRFQTFHRYCELNVALEATAELAYNRLIELSEVDAERDTFRRIRDDEARHRAAFGVLARALDEDDRSKAERPSDDVVRSLGEISVWHLPAALRRASAGGERTRTFGSGAPVVVRSGRNDAEKVSTLEQCLDGAGLRARAERARRAAIRVSFMLGYHRTDPSNINDLELVDALAAYLHRHGVADVAVLEAPTVYGNLFGNRSVEQVARYFGFESEHYRVVDIADDLRPFRFERGLVQQAISGTWMDADLRIVMPKLRTDPTEFAHICLSTLEGTTGSIGETFYANRQVDFRTATMMMLDVAPPDFAVLDAWAPVADGPFGVMGCRHPALDVRTVYAGADALAVDEVVLADLGVADPRRAPIVRRVHHWFGLPVVAVAVAGHRPDLATALRGAHASAPLRALGAISYPIYAFLSREGDLFVPEMDTQAFPPLHRPGPLTRAIRWSSQRAFGLRAPSA